MITIDKIKKIREKTDCNADTAREFLYNCDGDVSKAITAINRKAVEKAIINHFKKGKKCLN